MGAMEEKATFEQSCHVYERALLQFQGVEGFDVYNCSAPFYWEGKTYLYGRVERRAEWARSWVRLFEQVGPDTYAAVKEHMIYQLEDPYVSFIGGEMVLGGTHVRKRQGKIDTYYGYFYRGTDLNDLRYFTTGPDEMKDIRLVALADGRVGVFSRPRGEHIRRKYGSSAVIGFVIIPDLDSLNAQVIAEATPIEGLFAEDEWGGCNQAYLLDDGRIGVLGHQSFLARSSAAEVAQTDPSQPWSDGSLAVYMNIAFEFDPQTFAVSNRKIIGTRSCYPAYACKRPSLADCAFTSGMTLREDGRVNLYSGIGDTAEGRIVVDYPFSRPVACADTGKR